MLARIAMTAAATLLTARGGWAQWIATEEAKLTASDAAPLDSFGRSVAVSGETTVVGAFLDGHSGGPDSGSAYVFERDQGGPGAWGEVVKLIASDAADRDFFGYSVALSGDTALAGAYADNNLGGDDAGSAYVFERDQGGPGAWGEVVKLIASDAKDDDFFGYSVALSGDTALVGAYADDHAAGYNAGSAYVFERDQGGLGAWGEVVKLMTSDGAAGDLFGVSVSISGETAVVGWGEVAKLTASDAGAFDFFGSSVAVSGETAVVGAYADGHAGGQEAGSAYVFQRNQGGAWVEVAKLTASDAAALDWFGYSVAVSGDTVVVGAPKDNHAAGPNAGSAYVFERDQGGLGAWGEVVKLTTSDGAAGDLFGVSVSISGETAVVGTFVDDGDDQPDSNAGSAYVFKRDQGGAGAWGEVAKLTASDAAPDDRFGTSVAVSDDTAVVGAYLDDHPGGTDAGSAYVYGISFSIEVYCTAGSTASGCNALISATGTPSVTAGSGFDVAVTGLEGQKDGIIFWGRVSQASPWGVGTSYLCVQPPVKRTGTQSSGGTGGLCDGTFVLDFNTWMQANPTKAPAVGDVVHMQAWFRDPPSPKGTSLSDGLRFLVCP